MPNLHPFLVHFPVALLTVSVLFDTFSILLQKDDLSRSGWWTLVAGAVGLVGAVVSGLAAKGQLIIPDGAVDLFEAHESIAFLLSADFLFLLLWRIGNKTSLPAGALRRGLYFFLAFGGTALLWVGAWYGGEMVFRHGVGVR
jgi:uncharacterized membrane protein